MYVYCIQIKDFDLFKVGYSNNVKKRLVALQTAIPFDLEIISLIRCQDSNNARRIEDIIHEYIAEYHYRGEWFKMPKEKILYVFKKHNPNYPTENMSRLSNALTYSQDLYPHNGGDTV
jgi:hypothetical protein